jgi:hypothetical protein
MLNQGFGRPRSEEETEGQGLTVIVRGPVLGGAVRALPNELSSSGTHSVCVGRRETDFNRLTTALPGHKIEVPDASTLSRRKRHGLDLEGPGAI